jgi:hypothetical protein
VINRASKQRTTLENQQQYQAWKEELTRLENIDFDEDGVAWEYVDARIKALRADISSYEEVHAIIESSGVTSDMDDATYWNTIATYYDEINGSY